MDTGVIISLIASLIALGISSFQWAVPWSRVANWLSNSSQNRLTRRIAKLEKELAELEKSWQFTDSERRLFQWVGLATYLILSIGALGFLFIAYFSQMMESVNFSGANHKIAFQLRLIATCLWFLLVCCVVALARIFRHWSSHSTTGKLSLRRQIDNLKANVKPVNVTDPTSP
jgi:hypothetical protein